MARERSEMRRVKEVLRLRLAFGLSHKAISAACRMPRTTVRDYCQRAKAAGLDSFAGVEPLSERALEARLFTTGVDRDALARFLRFAYVPSPWSIYEGIRKLPPGSVLTVDADSARTAEPRVYWSAFAAFETRRSPVPRGSAPRRRRW